MGMLDLMRLRQYKIFISFHEDSSLPIAEYAKECLEKHGIKTFVSRKDLKPGDDWQASINYVIDRCCVFAPILTTVAALQSDNVRKEIDRARKASRIFIPLKHKDLSWDDVDQELGFKISRDQGIEFEDKHELYQKIDSSIKAFRTPCSGEYMGRNLEEMLSEIKHNFSFLENEINIRLDWKQGAPAELTTWMDKKQGKILQDAIEKGKPSSVSIKGLSLSQESRPRALHTGSNWELDIGDQKFETLPVKILIPSRKFSLDTRCKITKYGEHLIVLRTIEESPIDCRFELDLGDSEKSEMRFKINFIELSASDACKLYKLQEQTKLGAEIVIKETNQGKVIFKGAVAGIRWKGPDKKWYKIICSLAFIERRTGTKFAIPRKFTQADLKNIAFLEQVVKKGMVKSSIAKVSINVIKSEALRICSDFAKKPQGELILKTSVDEIITLLEKAINLGPSKFICPKTRLVEKADELRETLLKLDDGAYYRLEFEPLPRGKHNTIVEYEKWARPSTTKAAGKPKHALTECIGILPEEDAREMREIIEEEFEKVDLREWQ